MNKMIYKLGRAVLAMNLVVIMTPQVFADDKMNKPGSNRGGGASNESRPQSKPMREQPPQSSRPQQQQRQEAPRQEQRPQQPVRQEQPMQRQQPPQQVQPAQRPTQSVPPAQQYHQPQQQPPQQAQPAQRPVTSVPPAQQQRQPTWGDQNPQNNSSNKPDYRQPDQTHSAQRPIDREHSQQNMDYARQREQNWRNNSGMAGRVTSVSNNYYNRYNTVIVNRTTYINNYYNQPDYRYRYNSYFSYGFRSGYYYPVRPCYEINNYFNYPVLYWMYVSTVDTDYYRSWYNNDYYSYPVVQFQYARVYYPSESIRDLGMEVSAMPSRNQAFFRTALVNLTQALAQQIANNINYNFRLAENDIVVTEYQNLQNQAIVMEGFVDRDGIHAGFKALLDLNDPNQTLVFVPVNNYPTEAEQYTLRIINDRIYNLGGNPY